MSGAQPRPLVTVTIDTEEDNWGSYSPDGATVENIGHLPELHDLFVRYGARPTYFINRPPLIDNEATSILLDVVSAGGSEAGTHCHPWNTPPLDTAGPSESMMCNLSSNANAAKLEEVTNLIVDRLKHRPTSFRAGRWGFGPSVAAALPGLGYGVDSSVTPMLDWSANTGPDYSQAPLHPYRFRPESPLTPDAAGPLLEIPTTIGFLHGDTPSRMKRRRTLERSMLSRFKVVGILDRLGVLAYRWLSPETSTRREILHLADSLPGRGWRTLDFTFHSSTLLPGATPFVRTAEDRLRFLGRIEEFLSFCRSQNYRFATMAECAEAL